MDSIIVYGVVGLAVLAFVGWLGGGRKWAFRLVLSALLLVIFATTAIFVYWYWTDRASKRRANQVHDCAIAKVATAKCSPEKTVVGGKETEWEICPPYMLLDNPTPQDQDEALEAAKKACIEEIEPGTKTKSVREEVSDYRRQHGTKEDGEAQKRNKGWFEENAPKPKINWDDYAELNSKDCAARVRKAYPHSYDDIDDETLTKKVLAKYPGYCNVKLVLH